MDKEIIGFLKNGGYISFEMLDEVYEFHKIVSNYCKQNKITLDDIVYGTVGLGLDSVASYNISRRKICFNRIKDIETSHLSLIWKWSDIEIYFEKPQKEKETNMLKLLEMYKGRKTIEIEEKYDKQIHEIESNDAVQIFIEQAEQTLKGILNTENLKLNLNSDVLEYTQETIDAKNKIVDIIRKEKHELNIIIDEISALLELAPDFEQKMKILRDYGIIDKKKNVIL